MIRERVKLNQSGFDQQECRLGGRSGGARDGSIGWPELIMIGAATKGDWDKSSAEGKIKMMELTNGPASLWQHDTEQCVSPLAL